MPVTNREYKDSVFCDIFSDKNNALSLYNALIGKSYTDVESLDVVTLKDTIWIGMKNDVAILFHDILELVEHQSTVNPNMPFRGLEYYVKECEGWIKKTGANIFGSRLVKLPAPQYYILYNGTQDVPDKQEYKLSDAFIVPVAGYEWTAYVRNINKGHNEELMKQCPILYEYAELVAQIRDNTDKGQNLEEAVGNATNYCIENGILKGYLDVHRAEVFDMLLSEYTEQVALANERREGIEEGIEIGIEKGIEKGRLETLLKLVEDGVITLDQALEASGNMKNIFLANIKK